MGRCNCNDNYYEDTTTTARGSYTYSEYDWPQFNQHGWICPKCGRVNAPWVMTCPCYTPTTTYTATSTSQK